MSDIRSLALSRAYELVEAGKPDEARTVLEPILVNDRDNADAWWIYAHAVSDPNEARHALGNVMRVNPNYPGAAELKAALDQPVPRNRVRICRSRCTPLSFPGR
jgi:predicted Zn-dependent protease